MAYDQQQADLLRENVKLRATITDSTIARIAGNVAVRMIHSIEAGEEESSRQRVAKAAVALARAIVAEVQRTAPTR